MKSSQVTVATHREEGAVEVSEDKSHPPGDKDQVCIIRLLYWQTIKDVK